MADKHKNQRQGNPENDVGEGNREADRRYRKATEEDVARRARQGDSGTPGRDPMRAPDKDQDDSDL